MKIRIMVILIMLLIAIDQIIKIVINTYFLDTNFVIVPSLLEFAPKFNVKHSYVNVLLYNNFNIDLGLWIHVIFFLISQAFILLLYDFLKRKIHNNVRILDYAIVFQLSAMICVLSGNLIWEKGTLDYIYLKPLFIFDLKDLYLNCFAILFLVFLHKNKTQLKMINMKTNSVNKEIKK